jgi:crotonobetainyl-CoA:carnitine CoA-transferase CaiB-like acyl-CoA transferase
MRRHSREYWLNALAAAGVPCSPVHNLGEVTAHPHTAASDMVFAYTVAPRGPLKGVAQPLRFDGERPAQTKAPPLLGQHTVEILSEAGYSDAEVGALLASGVVQAQSAR